LSTQLPVPSQIIGTVEPGNLHLAPTFLFFPGKHTPGLVPRPLHLGAFVHTFAGLSQISPFCFQLQTRLQQVVGSPKFPNPGSHFSLMSTTPFPQRTVPVPETVAVADEDGVLLGVVVPVAVPLPETETERVPDRLLDWVSNSDWVMVPEILGPAGKPRGQSIRMTRLSPADATNNFNPAEKS